MPGFGHGPGSQSRDFLIAGVGQAVEQFPQIGVGFQAVAFGRLDHREDDRAGLARFFGTDESSHPRGVTPLRCSQNRT